MSSNDLRHRATANGAAAPLSSKDSTLDISAQDLDLPTLLDPASCTRKGLCPVTALRGAQPSESHSLYYELHGRGPERVVLIMGLNGSFLGWMHQVHHLARAVDEVGQPKYSVLVFDNRGVGNSGAPRGPYSTSKMAEDVLVLLDSVGWEGPRGVHVVGVSLGGMIAQELAWRTPERIASLVLAVTTAGGPVWTNFPPWYGMYTLTRLLLMSDRAKKVPVIVEMLFAKEWLNALAEDDEKGRTNREVQHEEFLTRMLATRTQPALGALSQMVAGLTHNVQPARLRTIASSIPYIVLVTGDEDHLVEPTNTDRLVRCMPGVEVLKWQQTGHAVQLQRVREFCSVIEKAVKEGRARCAEGAR
ncbi:alpha/beta-hydrolase [Vararia minispora EC-137]|uniref:Alpha/beta-hydrolase n=1 Tax=Vararia minispora EC-137 TaxID=1314806 RepID=A0ACB8QVG7_9AGAM|nr:alpha/beta-hydrolase [Vararia minispora EC-137]